MFAGLASCHMSLVFAPGGGDTVILFPLGCGDTVAHSQVFLKGGAGAS